MLKKKLNSFLNQHILNIDLLQKYKLKDLNNIPRIKETAISVNLNNFITSNINNVSEEFLQHYSTFILYSFGCVLPHIKLTKNNILTTSKKNFNLKIVLRNRLDIEEFLNNIFLNLLEKENIKNINFMQGESDFNIYIQLIKNLNLNTLENKTHLDVILSFKFNNKTMKKNFFFKKYPHFWLF